MTHEYTVATGGHILGGTGTGSATALAWAEHTILAVGDDSEVRAVSRGDSTFLDLAGRAVSAGTDAAAATRQLREAVAHRRAGAIADLVEVIEPGSAADLLLWSCDPRTLAPDEAAELVVVGVVRDGRLSWVDR
jgi:predicted amidohydrolase YtcJ